MRGSAEGVDGPAHIVCEPPPQARRRAETVAQTGRKGRGTGHGRDVEEWALVARMAATVMQECIVGSLSFTEMLSPIERLGR